MKVEKQLNETEQHELLQNLKLRFEQYMERHEGMLWNVIEEHLLAQPEKLWSLHRMEETGGEPDVINYDAESDTFSFVDCSKESPIGRRSVCYDQAAWEGRKKNRPETNAMALAEEIGIEMLTEEQYRVLQRLGEFDLKTSSWVKTPHNIRSKGGALFCDRRYDTVFLYHNGADSYYSSRGFRGILYV